MVDLETFVPDDPDASEVAKRLWSALSEDPDAVDELELRREATRRVAKELPAFLEAR